MAGTVAVACLFDAVVVAGGPPVVVAAFLAPVVGAEWALAGVDAGAVFEEWGSSHLTVKYTTGDRLTD